MTPDPRAVLTRALHGHAPFHLLSLSGEARIEARLLTVEDDELSFHLPPDHGLGLQDAVSILFSTGPGTYTFLARVTDLDGGQLWVPFPSALLSADRRLRPRLVVSRPTTVELAGLPDRAELVDLSPIGMRVWPRVAADIGATFEVTLRSGEHSFAATAQLRHLHGDIAGFSFQGSVVRGRVVPLAGLAELSAAVTEG